MGDEKKGRTPSKWAWDAADAIFKYIEPVTDRSTAIVLYTRLDESLYRLVEARMQVLHSKKVSDDFQRQLGPDGIFGSSKAKIMFAYALGLYGKQTYRELDTLRGIRNLFSHHEKFPDKPRQFSAYAGEEVRFSHKFLVDKCTSLTMAESLIKQTGGPDLPDKAIARYQATIMFYTKCFEYMMEHKIAIGDDGLGKEWGGALP